MGVYDSELKQFFVKRTYPVKKNVIFNFITNEDTDGIWFLVYAGIAGHTQGNSLHLKELTVRSCPLEHSQTPETYFQVPDEEVCILSEEKREQQEGSMPTK